MRAFTILVICGAGAGCTHALLRGSRERRRPQRNGLENPLAGTLDKRQKNGGGSAQTLSHMLDNGLGSWVSQSKLSQAKRMRHDLKLLARQVQAVGWQLARKKKELAFAQMFPNDKQKLASKGREVQRLKRVRQTFRAQQSELIDALYAFKRNGMP